MVHVHAAENVCRETCKSSIQMSTNGANEKEWPELEAAVIKKIATSITKP